MPITVYGLNLRYHQVTEISDRILKASDNAAFERRRACAQGRNVAGLLHVDL